MYDSTAAHTDSLKPYSQVRSAHKVTISPLRSHLSGTHAVLWWQLASRQVDIDKQTDEQTDGQTSTDNL